MSKCAKSSNNFWRNKQKWMSLHYVIEKLLNVVIFEPGRKTIRTVLNKCAKRTHYVEVFWANAQCSHNESFLFLPISIFEQVRKIIEQLLHKRAKINIVSLCFWATAQCCDFEPVRKTIKHILNKCATWILYVLVFWANAQCFQQCLSMWA